MNETVTRVAHAMVAAMRGQPSYVADEGLGCVTLDGVFDMRAVALAAMLAMEREPVRVEWHEPIAAD